MSKKFRNFRGYATPAQALVKYGMTSEEELVRLVTNRTVPGRNSVAPSYDQLCWYCRKRGGKTTPVPHGPFTAHLHQECTAAWNRKFGSEHDKG